MVERIRLLLEVRQLTPTQFADAIGIARPIVSHILSGRNKPSLEVVQRILAAMPDLSMPWLLNGTGPMLAGASPAPASSEVASNQHSAAPEQLADSALTAEARILASAAAPISRNRRNAPAAPARPLQTNASGPKRFAPPVRRGSEPATTGEAAKSAAAEGSQAPAVVEAPPVVEAAPNPAVPMPASAAELLSGSGKAIRRIVIFYQDGSFADYRPE